MKKALMLVIALLIVSISGGGIIAQNPFTLKGTVVSQSDGEPIAGAYVLINGTTIGTITDADGKFNISDVPASADEVVVSFLGMSTQCLTEYLC